ncbi:hypothetical protein [Bacteriovorax sp. DB6_IX]|uniref:hypothetical protein n=1 Tax=Bacteriovorax sp. DB6_IX TaxID=1353530 RepID=UPI000419A5AE|nr:hypothetical protein [Bacteriovorax sp. DB6_IX]
MNLKQVNTRISLVILASVVAQQVYGNLKNFSVNNENLKIATPKNWQVAKGFLSSAYTFFGPYKDGRRPVVSLNETKLGDYNFNPKELEKTQNEYREGRLKWLKRNKGGLLHFIPYKNIKWPHIGEVHSIGYNYTLLGQQFEERTYFFKCKKKVFNYSVLMTLKQKKNHNQTILDLMKSTKCE